MDGWGRFAFKSVRRGLCLFFETPNGPAVEEGVKSNKYARIVRRAILKDVCSSESINAERGARPRRVFDDQPGVVKLFDKKMKKKEASEVED